MTRYRDVRLAAHGSPASAGVRPEATSRRRTLVRRGEGARGDFTILKYNHQVKDNDFKACYCAIFLQVFSFLWCQLSIGDIFRRDVGFLSNIKELNGARLLVFKEGKKTLNCNFSC